MKIINQTRQTILAKEYIIPHTLHDQSLGLLKHPKPVAMLFKTRFGIHTFFMQYPIDVLILDKADKVAALRENLKPNHIFVWNPTFETVLELPAGTIEESQTNIGDKIIIMPSPRRRGSG